MKKILAFAGSNHSNSINYSLIEYTASLIEKIEVTVLDIKTWDIPIYSIDMDPDQTPELIMKFIKLIEENDGFIISSPEHNGGTPAFFKNIIDWVSRRSKNVFDNKPVLLMSTSPGAGGGANNLKFLNHTLPYQGANIVSTYSLPSFYNNMKEGSIERELLSDLKNSVNILTAKIIE